MVANSKNINEQLVAFANGEYEAKDFDTQCKAGWYDWFCRDSSLANKTKKLYTKLKAISKSEKFDNTKTYVFFKNNSSALGPLYDDFRICDIETGNVIYTVIPISSHSGEAEVWGKENDFDGPIVSGSWKDIKNWFLK